MAQVHRDIQDQQWQKTFFGYTWSSQGLSPDPKKVEAVAKLDPPSDPGQVRSILGMTNYCSRFIPKYSDITAPLRELTHDDTPWHWDNEQKEVSRYAETDPDGKAYS